VARRIPATLSPTSDPSTYLPEKVELLVNDEGEQPMTGDTTITPPVRIIAADRKAELPVPWRDVPPARSSVRCNFPAPTYFALSICGGDI
jgi:hypothetical protein